VVLVLPLSLLRLGQNIFVQLLSAAALICVFIIWVYTFSRHGLNNTVPVIGNNQTQLIDFVISNFAFVSPHVYMKFDSR
jgi:cell division septal protein FtsQ